MTDHPMPQARVRRRAGALRLVLALVVTAAAALTCAAAVPADDHGVRVTPPAEPAACRIDPKKGVVMKGRANRQDELCGSRGNDRFETAGGGDSVWAFQGNDRIAARDGQPDEIWGGPGGRDSGTFDTCDVVSGVERADVKGACRGVSKRGKRFLAERKLPLYEPVVECWTDEEGTRFIFFLFEPQMRALDVTDKVDFQTVAFLPVVTTGDGVDLELYKQGKWFWDRIYDDQVEERAMNEWRTFDNGPREWIFFTVDDPGTYRVGALYHWYKTNATREYQHAGFARAYYGPDGRDDTCEFA